MTACATNNDLTPESVPLGAETDYQWHMRAEHPHAFCGGCGNGTEECHPGVCCTQARDLQGVSESVCGYCPTRKATGQIRDVEYLS